MPVLGGVLLDYQLIDGQGVGIPLAYAAYVFVVLIVAKIILHFLNERKFMKRNDQLRLQFRFIQKQLDTHFTFNVLNSISASILNNNRLEAHKQLTVFSKVLRYIFDDKISLLHQLDKEISLIENYLILEDQRFKNKFDYDIHVDAHINRLTMVPKQIIQIFVDNAIRHGLMPLKSGGYLKINISHEGDDIFISIEDNGVGRAKAARTNTLEKKGYSIDIMYQAIDFLNSLQTDDKIDLQIFDLYKNGKASGTRTEIRLPSGYDPKLDPS